MQVADAAMAAGENLAQAAGILNFLHRQRLLEPTGQHGFCLTNPIRTLLEKQNSVRVISKLGPDVGTRSGPSRDQVKIIHHCMQERTMSELMVLVGRTNRTKFRNKVLKPMLDVGWIEMTIPNKPTSSKQQYRVTELGSHLLENR